jgi:hypothetical protein
MEIFFSIHGKKRPYRNSVVNVNGGASPHQGNRIWIALLFHIMVFLLGVLGTGTSVELQRMPPRVEKASCFLTAPTFLLIYRLREIKYNTRISYALSWHPAHIGLR